MDAVLTYNTSISILSAFIINRTKVAKAGDILANRYPEFLSIAINTPMLNTQVRSGLILDEPKTLAIPKFMVRIKKIFRIFAPCKPSIRRIENKNRNGIRWSVSPLDKSGLTKIRWYNTLRTKKMPANAVRTGILFRKYRNCASLLSCRCEQSSAIRYIACSCHSPLSDRRSIHSPNVLRTMDSLDAILTSLLSLSETIHSSDTHLDSDLLASTPSSVPRA